MTDNASIDAALSIPLHRPRKSTRTKLWFGGTLLAAFLLILVIGNQFLSRDKAVERNMLGHDFTAFYSAGHFAALGQFDKLYDVQAIKDFEQETGRRYGLSLGDSYGPYWNPPFYAWIFAPLSHFPYPQALFIWTLLNAACGLAATILLCQMLPTSSWQTRALVLLLLFISMPVIQALSHGQNTMTSLLLLTATVTFWRRGDALLAGLICGLLFYKPQLGAIVAIALIATLGWRSLMGLAITGTILLFITIATMPGALIDFLHHLPINVRFMQIEHPYVWERHATIKAFWRLLFQGRGAGEPKLIVTLLTLAICVTLAGGLCIAMWRARSSLFSDRKTPTPDSLIAATIATMPLLMPFYFDYDLMLLAIPAVLFAGEFVARASRLDSWLIRAWIALYLWMLINPGIAGATRVNFTVPLLTSVAAMLILRAIGPHELPLLRFRRFHVAADDSRGRQPRVRFAGAAAHG